MATEIRPGLRLPWTSGAGENQDDPGADETPQDDTIETAAESEAPPSFDRPDPETPPTRRPTKFMADLSRAMQAAAQTARAETMVRFEAEAKTVVDEIQVKATADATDLRRRADNDVAGIRDWSKAEIARIREQTEERIATRKIGLDSEIEEHVAAVEARVQWVASKVADFDARMAEFFERLNAEEDPTRIATMAETMPDPTGLAADIAALDIAPRAVAMELVPAAPTSAADADPEAVAFDSEAPDPARLDWAEQDPTDAIDFAAAEAEAASAIGDLDDEEVSAEATEPVDAGARLETLALIGDAATSPDLETARVVASGLVSVANIANFKRSLARTSGISTIAVASGPDGDFVFTVGHLLGSALSTSVRRMSGFDISITSESGDSIHVAAQDRDDTD